MLESTPIATDLLEAVGKRAFGTILADPPWRFVNRTGKMAPEHRRLSRYGTLTTAAIMALPVAKLAASASHLYLWVPNALLPDGLRVMEAWGFQYKSNIVWHKLRKDGGSDGRGVGFYFRNVTELVLFAMPRTKPLETKSRKPDELYRIIETCSFAPRLELFARGARRGWLVWGNQADDAYEPTWATYSHNSAAERRQLDQLASDSD